MKDDEIRKYEQFGIAAMLPGMIRAVEVLQAQIDDMRRRLEGLQIGNTKPAKRRGRPPAATGDLTVHGTPIKPGYWASMTAEERSAEMRRRRGLPKKRKSGMHPSNPDHPKHEQWMAARRKAGQARWAGVSKKARKEHAAAMLAARHLNGVEATQ